MKNLKLIILLPLVIFSLLMLIVSDLFRMLQGRPTLNDEWNEIHMDSNVNYGQGRKGNEERY